MKQKTKETLQKVLITAAMVTPPWNIFWWTVGGIAYAVSGGKKRDASGDGALGMVLAAPVTLPMMPFMLIKERRELREHEKRQALYAKVAEWIAIELARGNIIVEKFDARANGAHVRTAPFDRPQQEREYARIYALAVRHFMLVGLTIDEVCVNAKPIQPLNRAWAEKNGFTSWAEEVHSQGCVDCDEKTSYGWHFGQNAKAVRDFQGDTRHEITFSGGGKRIVNGHICQECLKKLDYERVVSY